MGKQARLRRERKEATAKAQFDTDEFCQLYATAAPAVIYSNFNDKCCVNATRVLIDVAAAFGVVVKPVVVKAIVMNAKQFELIQAHGKFPDDPETVKAWWQQGAYSVVIDVMADNDPNVVGMELNGWSGHLVGMAGSTLIDSSSRQLSRPAHNMEFPDIALIKVPGNFDRGGSVTARLPNGVVLQYASSPGVERYKEMSGWQRHPGNMDVARQVIIAIDKLLPAGWRARSRPKFREA